jgi:hypothetical protein
MQRADMSNTRAAAAPTVQSTPSNPVAVRTITIALWAAILTQKIALPGNIEITIVVMWAAILFLFARRLAFISLARVTGFAFLFAVIVATQIMFNGAFSLTAVLFVVPLYALFNFVVPMSNRDYLILLRNYQWIGLFVAMLVLAQWGAQFTKISILNIEPLIGDRFLYKYYNYIQPTSWGSEWIQPNGVIFLEASLLSQFLALALIIEVFLLQRPIFIGLFFITLVSTLAGTGIMMVILSAPLAFRIINARMILLGIVMLPLALAFMVAFNIDAYFLQRTQEFGLEQSSGYGRFIEPYTILPRIYERDPVGSILAGIGAGNIDKLPYVNPTLVLNPISKLIGEYGWLSAIIWILYIHTIMFRANAPLFVLVPLWLQFNLMNGSLLMPIEVAFCILLLSAPKMPKRLSYPELMKVWKTVGKSRPPPKPRYSMARLREEARRG